MCLFYGLISFDFPTISHCRESWLLVYVPRGASTSTYDTYQKVYARLCADFYSEKPADRCVMIINKKFSCSKGVNNNASNNGPLGFGLLAGGSSSTSASTAAAAQAVSLALQHQSKNCYSELMTKLKDGVVASFEHRCLLYDTEVRKGEAYRNSLMGGGLGGAGVMINANTLFDFKQLYLIKESLSLMYQMLTLYNEALVQLRELEVLLSYVPAHLLMDSQYPLLNSTVVGNNENGSVSSSSSARSSANASRLPGLAGSLPPNQSNQPPSSQSQYSKWRESWTDASKYGEEVMLYSINSVRMRVLKNKIGLLELQRYVYARIVYFLTLLGKPALVAEKGLQFLSFMRNTIDKKLAQEDDVTANQHQHQQLLLQQQQQQQFDSGSSRASHSSFQSPNPIQLAGSYDHASFSPAPSSTMHSSSPPTSYPSLGSGSTSSTAASVSIYPSRRALADVWVVTAAMKVVQYVMVQFNEEVLRVEEIHREGVVAVEDRPVMPSLHETCKNIVALLYYALSRLQYILVPEWNLKSLKSDSGSRAQAPSVLTSIWQIVMDMTALYTDWNSLSAVKSMYPFPFAPLKSDRERKCHRFINASASATTTISGVEEVSSRLIDLSFLMCSY